MSDLQNLTPANTYKGLLQVGDYTNGVDSTVKAVLDGEGTTSALAIGTTKVGIGTTSPSQELDVNGDIASTTLTASGAVTAGSVSTSGAVTGGSLDVSGNVVADEYALDQTGTSSSAVAIHAPATNELAIRTNSTEAMRIDSSGQVGIGIVNPSTSLDINKLLTESEPIITLSRGGTPKGRVAIANATSSILDGSVTNDLCIRSEGHNIKFGTAEATRTDMTITSSGNCGIGTASPNSKLVVQGDNADIYLRAANGIGSVGLVQDSNGYGKVHVQNNVGNNIISLDSTGPCYITTQNFGIGTETPSAPLEVTSTTGGVIMPRMNTTEMNAISSPTDGEMIYNTTENKFYGRANGAWTALH